MDRFRCEGCGLVTTDKTVADRHKNDHGLVVNIGPAPTEAAGIERRVRNDAIDGAQAIKQRLLWYINQNGDLLTLAERKVLGASWDTLDELQRRLRSEDRH